MNPFSEHAPRWFRTTMRIGAAIVIAQVIAVGFLHLATCILQKHPEVWNHIDPHFYSEEP